ncbi:MAG: sensor histidine kinase [Pseudomonadota bacterium]
MLTLLVLHVRLAQRKRNLEQTIATEEQQNRDVRKELQNLREALDITPSPFALYDHDNRLLAWNKAYENVHDEAFSKLPRPLYYEDLLRFTLDEELTPAEADREIAKRLQLHKVADGRPSDSLYPSGRWFRILKKRTASGAIAGFATDITELKHREFELEQANRAAEHASIAKSEFLAMMSHELRTPLNAIIGFSDIIQNEVFGEIRVARYKAYAQDIHNSGQHLLQVINQILDMSKAEAGKLEIGNETVVLNDLLVRAITMIGPRARQQQVTLEHALPAEELLFRGDSVRLLQILLNLLSNAVKFTPKGGRVHASLLEIDEGVAFEIEDTGIGISHEDLEKVLQPFYQALSTSNRGYEGTGLGLPLTKSLIELHGGRMELDSEVGQGTTVRVILPAERVTQEPRDDMTSKRAASSS